MPGGSVPIPAEVLEVAGDYKSALKDVERDVKSIDREIAKTLKKEGDLVALMEKKKALESQRESISSTVQQQQFDTRVNKVLDKRRSRLATQSRYTKADMMDFKDIYDLSNGEISYRNLKGAKEAIGKIAQQGMRGTVTNLASSANAAINGVLSGGAGVVASAALLPVAAIAYAAMDAQKGANDIISNYNKTTKVFDDLTKFEDSQEMREAIERHIERSGKLKPYGMEERIRVRNEEAQKYAYRLNEIYGDELTVANWINNQIGKGYGGKVSADRGSLEKFMLARIESRGLGVYNFDDMLDKIEKNTKTQQDIRDKQKQYWDRNPEMAWKFHEAGKSASFIEREKYTRSVRAW